MQKISGNTWVALGLAVCATLAIRMLRLRSIRHIRGPPVPSFLVGHELALNLREVGELDFQWMRAYGPTWRTRGTFGDDYLMTADAKALQHIFQKAGNNYVKRKDRTQLSRVFSPGIVSASGEVHRRQRKVMNPAFSPSHVRSFLPLFQRVGRKFCERIRAEVGDGTRTLPWNRWLSRATLDIIGQASFDYDFGALESTETRLTYQYKMLFTDLGRKLTRGALVFRATWQYLPRSLLDLMRYLPFPPFDILREVNLEFDKVGRELITRNAQTQGHEAAGGKDVISVLMRANASEDPRTRLDDTEVMAQLHTLTVAGHETTANTLSWLSRELALHPEYQQALREESRAARARRGGPLTLEDLDGMRVVGNVIKETLRMHPIVFHLYRVAVADDVIPLDDPITTSAGETITEIPISAGQTIVSSLCAYQRLPHVWGEDADVWNPARFDKIDAAEQTRVGLIANLMVFSSGHRGCIGWRFALMELQALLVELVDAFEFRLPENKAERDVVRASGGALMLLLVRYRESEGPFLPLDMSVAP